MSQTETLLGALEDLRGLGAHAEDVAQYGAEATKGRREGKDAAVTKELQHYAVETLRALAEHVRLCAEAVSTEIQAQAHNIAKTQQSLETIWDDIEAHRRETGRQQDLLIKRRDGFPYVHDRPKPSMRTLVGSEYEFPTDNMDLREINFSDLSVPKRGPAPFQLPRPACDDLEGEDIPEMTYSSRMQDEDQFDSSTAYLPEDDQLRDTTSSTWQESPYDIANEGFSGREVENHDTFAGVYDDEESDYEYDDDEEIIANV